MLCRPPDIFLAIIKSMQSMTATLPPSFRTPEARVLLRRLRHQPEGAAQRRTFRRLHALMTLAGFEQELREPGGQVIAFPIHRCRRGNP